MSSSQVTTHDVSTSPSRPTVHLTERQKVRFLSNVALPDERGCCLWTARRNREGYGDFTVKHRGYRAHRIAYEMFVGPIPDGMLVDHRCFTTACVAPEHLRVVTRKQNAEHLAGPRVDNGSGVRGVQRVAHATGSVTWRVRVRHHGHLYGFGTYPTVAEAEAAAVAGRAALFTHDDGRCAS